MIAPEIQLLFKSPLALEKDAADFSATFPSLDGARRAWLRQSLLTLDLRAHPWLKKLAPSGV